MASLVRIVRWISVVPGSFLGWFAATIILHNILLLVLWLFRPVKWLLEGGTGYGFFGMGVDFSLFDLIPDVGAETWELILFAFAGPLIMSVLAAIIAPNGKFIAASLLAIINGLHYLISLVIFLPPVLDVVNDYFATNIESEWGWPFRLLLFALNVIGIVLAITFVRENEYSLDG
jgi:hypothetical protein